MIFGSSENFIKSGPVDLVFITKVRHEIQENYGSILGTYFSYLRIFIVEHCVHFLRVFDCFSMVSRLDFRIFVFLELWNLDRCFLGTLNFIFLKFWRQTPNNDEDPRKTIFKSLDMNFIWIKNMKWPFAIFLLSSKGIPSTPQHSDSHHGFLWCYGRLSMDILQNTAASL